MDWTILVGIAKKYFKKAMVAIGIVDDKVEQLKKIGRFLSWWDCTAGLPLTEPPEMPYEYKTGDYFRVNQVGEVNYKPDGTHYTGEASTVVETNEVKRDYIYFYDGTAWTIIEVQGVKFEEIAGDPNDNPALFTELNKKFNIAQGTEHAGKAVMIDEDGNAVPTSLPPAPVTSVNGKAGAVVLDKTDIGLDKVVNTGDSATPTQGGTNKFTTGGAYELYRGLVSLESGLVDEARMREQKDTVLSNTLSLETNARQAEDTKLNQKIAIEASTRLSADANLSDEIEAEADARATADTALSESIATEAINRAAADDALSDRIDDIIAEGCSWSEVKDKPFNTIGSGLKVESNALKADCVADLSSEDDTKPLAASQGLALADYVDANISDTMAYVIQEDREEKAARQAGDNLLDTNKQDKTDNSLQTTSKNIVGAINEVLAKTAGVFRPKGSVATYDDLPDDPEVGDVYNVLDTGKNYVWTVDEYWDDLAGEFDLHEYRKAEDQDDIDDGIKESITAEAIDRENADTNLSNAITLEAANRTIEDNALRASKQDNLISGTNIKTINGQSVLGPGDIEIEGATYTGSDPININAETNVISLKDKGVTMDYLGDDVKDEFYRKQYSYDEDLLSNNKHVVPAINELIWFLQAEGQPTYIQTDGNAYIKTGITDYTGLSVDLDIEWPTMPARDVSYEVGAYDITRDKRFYFGPVGDISDVDFCAGLRSKWDRYFIADNKRHNLKLYADQNIFMCDGRIVDIENSGELPQGLDFPLFARNDSGTFEVREGVKIYSAKFRRNGTPILQLFPIKESSGEFVMRDLLTGTTYRNAGTGAFTGDAQETLISLLAAKQNLLKSGQNIKTIQNTSLLGSGNIAVATGVKGNSESTYRNGNVNITKANIGLGNVDNTSDADKPVSTAVAAKLGEKQNLITGAASTVVASNLTANRVVGTNSSGKLAVCNATATEVNYLTGTTSNIQTQLNNKVPATTNTEKIYGTSTTGTQYQYSIERSKMTNSANAVPASSVILATLAPTFTAIPITSLKQDTFTVNSNSSYKIDYSTHTVYYYHFGLKVMSDIAGATNKYISLYDDIKCTIHPSGHLPFNVSCSNTTYPLVSCEVLGTDFSNIRLYIPNGLHTDGNLIFNATFIVKK